MQNKKKDKADISSLIIFVTILAIIFLLIFNDNLRDRLNTILARLFAGLILAVIIQPFVIAIHEAGHLVFGLLSGYSFCSFRVRRLIWLKDNTGIRFKRYPFKRSGGQCIMIPPDLVDGRMPFLMYNLGGSLMNLITTVICAAICLIYRISYLPLIVFAALSLIIGLLDCIPMRSGRMRNALDISESPEIMRAFRIQLKLNEQLTKGMRLKDMPEDWFVLPEDAQLSNGIIASLAVFACLRLMDEHRFDEAEARMTAFLAKDTYISRAYECSLACDRIYCELIGPNRVECLDSLYNEEYKKFEQTNDKTPAILRTQYAYVLLHRKNEGAAQAVLKRFEAAAKNFPTPVDIEAERELLEIARQSLENTENATAG